MLWFFSLDGSLVFKEFRKKKEGRPLQILIHLRLHVLWGSELPSGIISLQDVEEFPAAFHVVQTHPLVTVAFHFLLSENGFILPSVLKDTFTGCLILGWWFLFFHHFEDVPHFLAPMISHMKPALIGSFFPCAVCSSVAFKLQHITWLSIVPRRCALLRDSLIFLGVHWTSLAVYFCFSPNLERF